MALVSGNNLEVVSSSWWTRTLGENGLPMHFGKDGTLAESTAEGKHGVRPAMNLNPSLLLGALWEARGGEADYVRVLRTAILREDFTPFA